MEKKEKQRFGKNHFGASAAAVELAKLSAAEETSKTDVIWFWQRILSKKSHFVLVEFESNERRKLLLLFVYSALWSLI